MSHLSPLDHLINVFEARARMIARDLCSHYENIACERYVTHFVLMHTEHIQRLRSGDFSSAYALLRSIGRLSQKLERDELSLMRRADKPRKKLKFRPERFRRGPMVCGYVAGDFREFSPKFDNTLSKIMAEEPSILKISTWVTARGQQDAAEVYNLLADNCAIAPELYQEAFPLAS